MKITISIIISTVPLLLYLFNFNYGLSKEVSDWAAFGSYAGGVYGALAFIAIALSTYITRNQFMIQHENEVFYKSVESLTTNKFIISRDRQGDHSKTSIAKSVVLDIQAELTNQSAHMARKVLCKNPSLISYTNIDKIVNAINSTKKTTESHTDHIKLLLEINNRQNDDDRREYLEYILGGIDDEEKKVKQALKDAGSTSFYHANFCHRKYYYNQAWYSAENKHSEELNIYLRKINFILHHIKNSKLKYKYEKYLYSQISKYDCVLLYYYALTSHNFDTVKLLLDTEILEKEIKRDESTMLLFDSPSEEQVTTELQFIKEK